MEIKNLGYMIFGNPSQYIPPNIRPNMTPENAL